MKTSGIFSLNPIAPPLIKYTNGEFTETVHSNFKISERTHGFQVNRMIVTPIHAEKSLKSLVGHNSRRAGFTPPSKFSLRKSSCQLMSPTLNTINKE